jgi:O-antigen/teichoic acid export membrane protein
VSSIEGEPPAPAGDSIKRNTAFALAAQAATALFTAGLTLYLVRALGPDDYGVFALALAVGLLVLQFSDFGISQSMARFIAEHRHDQGAIGAIFSDALRLRLISGFVVSGALFALASPIANAYDNTDLVWPLRAMAVAVFAQGLMTFIATPFVPLRRLSLNLRVVALESAIEASASVALVLLGGGAAGAVFGRAIGYAAGAVIAFVLLWRLLGWRGLDSLRRRGEHLRRIAGYAGAMLIIEGTFTLFGQVDALVIGAYLTTADVGFFQAPNRLTTILAYPGLAIAAGVAPRLSRGGEGPDVLSLQRALRLLLILQAAMIPPVVVWADPITDLLLGSAYADSADVLRALAPYIFVSGLAALLSIGVNYLGEARRRVPIAIAALLVNLVIDLILVPRIGIVGAAIGTDVAYVLYVGAHLWILRRLVELPLRPLAPTAFRSAVAALAMAAVLWAFGTSDLGAPALVAGAIAAPLAFAAVLLASREFSSDELAIARATVAARLHRRR